MNNWMVCTTCQRTVLVNETGTCLRCMRGFGSDMAEDDYLYLDQIQKLKQEKDALEERIQEVDYQRQHKRAKELGKKTKPSSSNSASDCS